jgi:hypothetical protein
MNVKFWQNIFQKIIRRIGWEKYLGILRPTVMMVFLEVGMFRTMHFI